MDKRTKKRVKYNTDILNALKEKYGVELDYIRKSIRGDRTGTLPIRIAEEYKSMQIASKKAINSKIRPV